MSAVSPVTDWTQVWVDTSPLSPGEVILSVILLTLTVIIETLSYIVHHYSDSVKQIDTSIVRTPSEQFDNLHKFGYYFNSYYLTLPLQSKPGHPRVHYLDEGPRDSSKILLLLHGEPFWSFSWTKVIPGLSSDTRVIVPDLVGFGKSDKYVDWRMYDLNLHIETITLLLDSLGISGTDGGQVCIL